MKAPSTYSSRLALAMVTVLEISAGKGLVEVSEVAKALDVTERMAREYLSDLEELGLLEYVGLGVYSVKRSRVRDILMKFEAEGGIQLRIQDFMVETPYFHRKAARLLSKIKPLISRGREIRELLLKSGQLNNLCGDRALYTKEDYISDLRSLENATALGEASTSEISNYVVGYAIPLTVSYIASAIAELEFGRSGELLGIRFAVRPKLREFKEEEPFEEGEPLYELSVEYPELLLLGRKIATRLLRDIERYKNLLGKVGKEPSFAVTLGSLRPHGFTVSSRCRILDALLKKSQELFEKVIDTCSRKGLTLVSLVNDPRDNRFVKTVSEILNLNRLGLSDIAFLSAIMLDGDATAPMKLEEERGRRVKNWYEFYFRRGLRVFKIEYVTTRDPIEVQKEIIGLLYPQFEVGGRLPFVSEALARAKTHVNYIRIRFEAALKSLALPQLGLAVEG